MQLPTLKFRTFEIVLLLRLEPLNFDCIFKIPPKKRSHQIKRFFGAKNLKRKKRFNKKVFNLN